MKKQFYLFLKRAVDIFASIIGILMFLLVSIVVKIFYLCTKDFKSIIYVHERIGKNGKKFKMYKFRTMVWNSQMFQKLLQVADAKLTHLQVALILR